MKRKVSSGVSVVMRRNSVLDRLQTQLKSGVKMEKGKMDEFVPLTEKDVTRIKHEIEILKTRV